MRVTAFLLLLLLLSGCERRRTVWVYTSLYKEVIAELEPMLERAVPEVKVEWFQGGSENVATKLNTELAAGRPKADVVVTSDPFWYLELKKAGQLLPYESPAAAKIPARFRDPDGAFTVSRVPVMVLAYNSEVLQPHQLPNRWTDLSKPQWKDKISMPSPLESGTGFTAVAMLSQTFGWDLFEGLRRLEVVAAGGNSSVINRIVTRERPLGIVLLENVLAAQKKGAPVRPIYPLDGVIPIPSPIAILKATKEPEAAKRIYDWFFSVAVQNVIVRSGMYSPVPGMISPDNARPWEELEKHLMGWSPELLEKLYLSREPTKAKFSQLVLH